MSRMDELLISGDLFDYSFPKEKSYLMKYFKTDVQRHFISYLLLFGDYGNYVDHTGVACKKRYMQFMYSQYKKIEEARDKARAEFDIELLAKIDSGDFSINSFPKS